MTDEALAVSNCTMLSVAGSDLYGTALETGDQDYMGVCLEPMPYVIGLNKFEQYQYHSAGEGNRSQVGDIDCTIYSLRKWARLAADGNPTVLLLGFAPDDKLIVASEFANRLRAKMDMFWTQQAGSRFLGYLDSQRSQMLGLTGRRHSNRPELVEQYGYDTKFAYHAVRLGLQGIEFMSTGRITLPMSDYERGICLDVRKGKYTKDDVVWWIDELADELNGLRKNTDIPEQPDLAAINDWLTTEYLNHWEQPEPCGFTKTTLASLLTDPDGSSATGV